MQNSLWKLTALAGVVGIGFLAVLQAQKGLNKPLEGDAATVAEENPGEKDEARGGVEGIGDFEPAPPRSRSTPTSVPRAGRSAAAAEDRLVARSEQGDGDDPFDTDVPRRARIGSATTGAARTARAKADGGDPFGTEDAMDEAGKSRATRPRGLDFRDEAVPIARRAKPASGESDDVPFGDDAGSDGVTRAGGESRREPARLDVEPDTRRVVPAGNDEPADDFDPFEERADSKRKTGAEPRPLEPSADMEPRELTAPGPALVAPGGAKSEFDGDDLPSQPARPESARSESARSEPARRALPRPTLGDSRSRDGDDPKRDDPKFSDSPTPDTDPVVGDFPRSTRPAAGSDPFGDSDPDPGYRRTREPKPRAAQPNPDLRTESDSSRSLPPLDPAPSSDKDRAAPPKVGNAAADPFGDIPLDGSFGDAPPSTAPKKSDDKQPEPTPERDPLPRRDDPTSPRDRVEFDPLPRGPRDSTREYPERDMPSRSDSPARRETTPRSTVPNDPLPRRDDIGRDEPRDDPRRNDRPDPLPRSNRDPLNRDTSGRNEPDRRDLIGDGVVAPNTPKGPQRPQLKIEKLAPQNAVIGQPLVYNIVIRNLGEIAAHDVVVEDRIPKGTELSGTIPRAELVDKTLVWKLGTMQPNEEKKIAVRVTPVAEGQIGSIATVNFVAEVGAKTLITAPKLQLDVSAPAQARTGEAIPFVFRLKNVGSADARGVIIRDIVPEGLRHPDGNDLEYELGTLGAGQSREVRLTLTAVKAGPTSNRAVATADGNITEEKSARVDIVGPALSISRTGPKKTYLGRQATYATIVSNESDRTSDGATVVETVPAGFDYVDSTPAGNYSPQDRTLSWRLDRMRSGDKTELKVRFLAKSAGAKSMKVRVVEGGALSSEVLAETEVVGAANLESHVSTGGGPLGVGDKATFRIVVRNRGNDGAGNVRLKLTLPDEVEFVSSDHRNTISADGREVTFPSIARLEAGRDSSLQLVLRAVKAGDVRLTLHTEADDMRPIAKEEQVVILADEESSVLSTPRR